MAMFSIIKLSKRVKEKLPMVTPGQCDADILPGGGSMSSGLTLDYRAIQVGNNSQVSNTDDDGYTAPRGALQRERPKDLELTSMPPRGALQRECQKPRSALQRERPKMPVAANEPGSINSVDDDNTRGNGSFVGSKEEGFPLRRNMSLYISKRAYPDYPAYTDEGLYSQVSERMPATPAFNIFDTYFADDAQPKKPFAEFIAELRAKQELVNKRIEEIISSGEKTSKFESKHGGEIIVHPSTRRPGKWQMTWFNDGIPAGHLDCETQLEALKEAHKGGANLMTDVVDTSEANDEVIEAEDDDAIVNFAKLAFVKTAVTYDSNPIIQGLLKIPQVKSLLDQQASGFVDKIVVTTPGADIHQTQQQLNSQPGQNTNLKPIDGNPYGHMWMSQDPKTHETKPLDKIVRIDRVTDQWGTLVTILHEIAHHRHPNWSESQVEAEAKQNADTVAQYLGVKNASANKKKILFIKNSLHSLPLVECDLADTYQKQVIGLQNHSSLRPESGMLFTYGSPQSLSFWMGTVKFPIDIIFADADNRIVKIYRNCPPKSTEIYSCGQATKVIEVVGSFCAFHDLNVGDRVFEANDEAYEQEDFTKYIMEKIKEVKLEQQKDLGMADWSIKIVMKKEPDSRRFLKVNWDPGDYKIKKADILVNPDPLLIDEALKEMPLEKHVRHALLHILTGHKKELPEDREQELITSRLFKEERNKQLETMLQKRASINKSK